MSLVRTNLAGWAIGEELTSGQITAVDAAIEGALDKRSAQTDTLQSVVTLSGAGRIIQSYAVGANADTTYVAGGANQNIQVTSAVLANRVYTLSAAGAQTGDTIAIFCEPTFNFEITVKDQASATMFTVGNTSGASAKSDGTFAMFGYVGGWRLLFARTRDHGLVYTTAGSFTLTVPPTVTQMLFEGVGGGGGGGGGGPGSNTGESSSASGGGGARRGRVLATVIPGETLTIVVGAGGAGGNGATTNNNDATSGGHGSDTTVTGSTSGLLATFIGAMGGVRGFYSGTTLTVGFQHGGMPCKLDSSLSSDRQYMGDNAISATSAGFYPYAPVPGQGGHAPSPTGSLGIFPRNYQQGGGTGYARGGVASYTSTGSGAGGASEWPGGVGGVGVLTAGGGTNGNVGQPGTLGSGGSGGSCTTGAHPGGNGGNGGGGACIVSWVK